MHSGYEVHNVLFSVLLPGAHNMYTGSTWYTTGNNIIRCGPAFLSVSIYLLCPRGTLCTTSALIAWVTLHMCKILHMGNKTTNGTLDYTSGVHDINGTLIAWGHIAGIHDSSWCTVLCSREALWTAGSLITSWIGIAVTKHKTSQAESRLDYWNHLSYV